MAKFEFAAPTTLDEALDLLAGPGEVRPLTGGTDLIDQLNTGRRTVDLVVDIKRIPELQRLDFDSNGFHIGGARCCTDVHMDPTARSHYAGLAESCGLIGAVQIQNRAAVAGNVCNAAPSADTVPCLIAHGCKAIVASKRGRREVTLEEFFVAPGQTVLRKGELLAELVLPAPPDNSASAYLRFIPRNEMDIAVVGVGCFLELDASTKVVRQARIALASVAPTPVRANAAERVLEGRSISEELVTEAGEAAVQAARPISDVRGSADYRSELVKVLTRRVLRKCVERINGTAPV